MSESWAGRPRTARGLVMVPFNLRHLGPVTYWAVDADGTLLAVPIERSMAVAA